MFPRAHGESRTKGDQEPRRDKLVFRYSSLGLGMHWASTKLKLNFYLINLIVAFTGWKKLRIFVFLFWNTMKQTHLQIKRSRLKKKKAFQAFILIRKPKESPQQGIEPRSPAWQAGILTSILPRNECVRFRLRVIDGETPLLSLK